MYTRPNMKQDIEDKNYENTDLEGKQVLLRSCLNVKLKDGKIKEDARLVDSAPVIRDLASKTKRLVVMGHLGRPKGEDPSLSLQVVVDYYNDYFDGEIPEMKLIKSPDSEELGEEGVYMLENVRFFPGEKSKDEAEKAEFAEQLATLGEVYVNDAFADSAKKDTSTYDIAKLLPSYLGTAFIKEIKALSMMSAPERPFVVVFGGAKLSDKLKALNALIKDADKVIVGGAMAYTLLKAQGHTIGNSLVEEDAIEDAKKTIEEYGDKLVLPVDHLVVEKFEEPEDESGYETVDDVNIPEGKMAVDIGPKTIQNFKQAISEAKSIIWNGPMGVFEWDVASKGTKEIGQAVGDSEGYAIVGGGDSINAINELGLEGFDHICTGGGALLKYFAKDKHNVLDAILG